MSTTDDDWTAVPAGQPAPGSLRLHVSAADLFPPQLVAQCCAAFAALTVGLMSTVPDGTRSVTPEVEAAAGIAAPANPDPVPRDPSTGRFSYEPATGALPETWWVRLRFDRGFPSVGALLSSLDGKVREARIEERGEKPVIAVRLNARTDESVIASARRITDAFRQRPDASAVRLNFGTQGRLAAETGIDYELAGAADEPAA